jgi:heat shock 70kDa protein 1/2/6/8
MATNTDNQQNNVIIGIDLGTTYSAVSVYKNGSCEIITNDQGNRTTPSWVAFTETEKLVGEAAKNQVNSNPENTIFDIKRFMGLTYDDPKVQAEIKRMPYKVINKNNKPHVQVQFKGETKEFSPEQISAFILTKMKQTAEDFLGHSVHRAVITVPAYFSDAQRQATKDAGQIAGLTVERIVNEPTAAALAYGLDKKGERNVLIFDFGGGTHDISVLNIDDGVFEVLGTGGNVHLGGEDIDDRLTDYFAEEFKRQHKLDIRDNKRSVRRLKTECEKAKRVLSSSAVATVQLESLYQGIDFSSKLTRAKFETLCGDIFRDTMKPIDQVLSDAGIDKSQIHDIVLVGGSTRNTKISQLLSEYFNGKELCKGVNPDEVVAVGAGLQAGVLKGEVKDVLLLDVCPLSLGVETSGNIMTVLIPRGTSIPTSKTQTFTTYVDNQPACSVVIYEGERKFTKDCHKLGEFTLNNIPPMRRGQPKIEITYEVDANSILTVTAKETSTGKSEKLSVTGGSKMTPEEIERMVEEAKKFEDEDKKNFERVEAKNGLESYAYNIQNMTSEENTRKVLSEDDLKTMGTKCDEAIKWLDENQNATKEEYDNKKKELESVVNPIVAKMYGGMPPGGMPDGMNPSDFAQSSDGSNVQFEDMEVD